MKLVIVESPNKTQTIGRYLGPDFKVMASEGHIRDLSTRGKGGLGIDIDGGFVPDWEISKGKERVIRQLSDAAKKAEVVYLATDPDREGEAISYHLAKVLGLPLDAQTRLQFREITRPAVTEALSDPKKIDMNVVNAQEVRRMEDRIIGFKVSGLLRSKMRLNSAGRVQSSTLKLIVDRKKAIDAFVPQEYWTIEAVIKVGNEKYKVNLTRVDGRPFKCGSKQEADALVARIGKTLVVSSKSSSIKSISPKPPFTTSTMQQEAYSKFGFSNSRTQSTAQKLYEGLSVNGEHVGLITYMRTDSVRISPNFYNGHAIPFITETYGKEYIGPLRGGKNDKNVQDAHEAIRMTGTHRTPEIIANAGLTADQIKLYRLIYCRALASMMAPKKVESTNVIFSSSGLDFSLSGSKTIFPGFSVVYGEFEEDESKSLPDFKQGEDFEVIDIKAEQKFTKPEPLYNEATIVKAMEEKGIGRPSTYASTIKTLLTRKYVTSTKGVLEPTPNGTKAVETLEVYFPDIVSSGYTALMENKLDKVEEGEESFLDAMNEFYIPFMENYENAQGIIRKEVNYTGDKCPLCGRPLVYKVNRKGEKFVSCSGYPHCTYIPREEAPKPEVEYTGENCPDCGAPLIYKKSKKGEKFVGCSNFPKCRYTASLIKVKTKPKEAKVYTEADYVKPCPECGSGHLVVKQGKKVQFYGCTNYPKCRHVEWITPKKGKEK